MGPAKHREQSAVDNTEAEPQLLSCAQAAASLDRTRYIHPTASVFGQDHDTGLQYVYVILRQLSCASGPLDCKASTCR